MYFLQVGHRWFWFRLYIFFWIEQNNEHKR